MKVRAYVYVIQGGRSVLLRPGDTVPAGVKVTNPDVIEADAVTLPAPAPEHDKGGDLPTSEPAVNATGEPEPVIPAPAAPRKRTPAKPKAAPAAE